MNKEKLKLLVLVGLLILVFLFGVWITSRRSSPANLSASPTPSPVYENPPLPSQLNKQGDRLLAQTKEYNIVFQPTFNSYLIVIYGSPFETVRKEAETEFMRQLNLSQKDTCELNVRVSTPYYINPNEADKIYPLSFCSSPSPS